MRFFPRFLLTALFCVLLFVSSQAQTKVKVICRAEDGGLVVTTSGVSSSTKHVRTFPGATVNVYQTGTTTPISLWSDAGGITVLGNPITASSTNADCSFFATPGQRIDIRYSGVGAGIASPFTRSDIQIPYALDTFSNTATYITKTPDSALLNEVAMSLKATGLVKNTTGTGDPSIAVANTDYLAPSQAYFTLTGTGTSNQTFIQVDQISGTNFPTYATLLLTNPSTVNGNRFGVVSVVNPGALLVSALPAGHLSGYVVGVYGAGELGVSSGQVSNYSVYGGNFKGELGAFAPAATNARAVGVEVDVNNGKNPLEAFGSEFTINNYVTGIHLASGGNYPTQAGIQLYASSASTAASPTYGNKFIRGLVINSNAYYGRAIEIGNTTGVTFSIGAELAIGQISTRSAIAVQPDNALNTGNAFGVFAAGGTTLLSGLEIDGDIYSSKNVYVDGVASKHLNIAGEGFQYWKDATPTKAWNFGMKVPGGSLTNNFILAHFNGSAWATKFKVQDDGTAVINEAVNLTAGAGAPTGACVTGSVYFRTDGGVGSSFYVCEATAWAAK